MSSRVPHATVVLRRRGVEVASWTLMGPPTIDLALIDEVARWALAARRLGCSIWLRGAGHDLLALLAFCGLGGLGVEVGGEAAGLEQLGVEEGVEPGDPAI